MSFSTKVLDLVNGIESVSISSSATSSYSLILPDEQGSNNQTLVNNGSGDLSWEPAAVGGIPQIQVSQDGNGNYTTIEAAVTAANLMATPVGIMVWPGSYALPGTQTLGPAVSITGLLTQSVRVTIAVPNVPMFIIDLNCTVKSLTLIGTGTVGMIGIKTAATGAGTNLTTISTCQIIDADIAIDHTAPFNLICFDLSTLNPTVTATAIFNVDTAAGFVATGGSYTSAALGTFATFKAGICQMSASLVIGYTNGMMFENGITAILKNIIYNAMVNCFVFDVNATAAMNVTIDNCILRFVTNSVIINATTYNSLAITSTTLEYTTIQNPNNLLIEGTIFSNEPEHHALITLGNIEVGQNTQLSRSFFGGGRWTNIDFAVQSHDGGGPGTWVDHTGAVGTFPIFQGTGIGNAIYFGSETPLTGVHYDVTTAIAGIGEEIDIQYWNGVGWTSVDHMSRRSNFAHFSFSIHGLEDVSEQDERFGLIESDYTTKLLLNGYTKYWIRYIITSVTSGSPIIQEAGGWRSSTEISTHGFIGYFGDARTTYELPILQNSFQPGNASPSNQDLRVSSTIVVGLTENLFLSNTLDRLGIAFALPPNTDTSFPIKFSWSYVILAVDAGDIEWTVRRAFTLDDAIDSGAISSVETGGSPVSPNQSNQSVVVSMSGQTIEKQITTTQKLSIQDINVQPEVTSNNIIWITLERDGGAGNDSYDGNAALFNFELSCVIAYAGGNLNNF